MIFFLIILSKLRKKKFIILEKFENFEKFDILRNKTKSGQLRDKNGALPCSKAVKIMLF